MAFNIIPTNVLAFKMIYDLELHAVQFELFLDCICAAFPHKGCRIKLPGSLGKAPSNVFEYFWILAYFKSLL